MDAETNKGATEGPVNCYNCGGTVFTPKYECLNTTCGIISYDGDSGEFTPDSLPTKKNCPGCQTLNYTYVLQCDQCGMVHDFRTENFVVLSDSARTKVDQKFRDSTSKKS